MPNDDAIDSIEPKPNREEVERNPDTERVGVSWWCTHTEDERLQRYLALLDENERLKLTLTDERSLYADLAEKNEKLKETVESFDMLGSAWQRDVAELDGLRKKYKRQAEVVEAAKKAYEAWVLGQSFTGEWRKLGKALAKLEGKDVD